MPLVAGLLTLQTGTLAGTGTGSGPACRADVYNDTVEVQYVIDGDTVKLASDSNLRLIGLDTPEIGRQGHPDEPGAAAARNFLAELLGDHPRLPVVFDSERHDRYGRLLGHLFLADGTNIQALLLAEGYGTPLIIPPNLKFLDCYHANAEAAIRSGHGVWSNPRHGVIDATNLGPDERGYRMIRGRVTRTGASPSSIWVNMGDNLALRIVMSDLKYFTGMDVRSLTGKTVLARGKVYQRNRQLRIRIRHPVDLQILPD